MEILGNLETRENETFEKIGRTFEAVGPTFVIISESTSALISKTTFVVTLKSTFKIMNGPASEIRQKFDL